MTISLSISTLKNVEIHPKLKIFSPSRYVGALPPRGSIPPGMPPGGPPPVHGGPPPGAGMPPQMRVPPPGAPGGIPPPLMHGAPPPGGAPPPRSLAPPPGPVPHVNPAFFPPHQGPPPGHPPPSGYPPGMPPAATGLSEVEFEEIMSRNRTVSSSAIARAVQGNLGYNTIKIRATIFHTHIIYRHY